jgi:predicted DNA binding CopG/RHH family protein
MGSCGWRGPRKIHHTLQIKKAQKGVWHMKNKKRDVTAKEIEDNIGDWTPVPKHKHAHVDALLHRVVAKEIERKEARFTMRIKRSDLERLKSMAEEQGLKYQSLVGSMIHKLVTGKLVDKTDLQKTYSAGTQKRVKKSS